MTMDLTVEMGDLAQDAGIDRRTHSYSPPSGGVGTGSETKRGAGRSAHPSLVSDGIVAPPCGWSGNDRRTAKGGTMQTDDFVGINSSGHPTAPMVICRAPAEGAAGGRPRGPASEDDGGRYWTRTSDLSRVRRAL